MSDRSEAKIEKLERALGYVFSDRKLLRAAITHRSTGVANNERLEFLGDSILNFVIAAELYQRFPKAREGDLTRLRALLVRGETVAQVARDLKIGDYLTLGEGELKSGGHQRESILADAMEAIMGALYLDANLVVCQQKILVWYQSRLASLTPEALQKDAKTELQEYLQARHLPLPEYEVIGTLGSPHNPTFRVECKLALLKESIIGVANSRRKAEQMAAESALKVLKDET